MTPAPSPQFLSDLGAVDNGGGATPESGAATIDGHSFASSVWLCTDLEWIPNIYCESTSEATWADYNIPAGYRTFQATIGFSSKSASDCDVTIEVLSGSDTLFSREIHYGDSIPVSWSVAGKIRLRTQVIAAKGARCLSVFGNAAFLP